ncbi:MAG: ATP phosphoribosyltransferase regulatory subunit [Selenomonadaceae bacterium]|nr:ATP phosphoribosyltransferase regulatory subunit [Selenomonadaceae bacterium]MBR1860202.1 ATP phosphoribosyltransferase regulatory subunit [Selenomonadaceae bacterium]
MSKQILETPYGTQDFLPKDAATKRLIEQKILKLLQLYGYEEVVTPTIEYLDTLMIGSSFRTLEPHMFKMFDRSNRTLALRHEMTTPIARLTASRLKNLPMPLKLSYSTNVFRYEHTLPGRQCEFYQAGVELIGSSSVAADAEVIALAIESLKTAGLTDFELCLNNIEFVIGIMEQNNLDIETKEFLKTAIENHDLVALEQKIDELPLTKNAADFLKNIPFMHGGKDILNKARTFTLNERSRRALDNLAEIYQLLETYGVADKVTFDLGLIRDFSYYTGMVFEAYAPNLGYSLAGGGRYDHMLKDFGLACPATGFALGIERIMLARKHQGITENHISRDIYLGYSPSKINDAITKAKQLRDTGKVVDLALMPQTEEEARQSQLDKACTELIYLSD